MNVAELLTQARALPEIIDRLAESYHAMSWLTLALCILCGSFAVFVLKFLVLSGRDLFSDLIGWLRFPLGSFIEHFEVFSWTLACALVVFVPLSWIAVLIPAAVFAGYGAYRRQHSRFLFVQRGRDRRGRDRDARRLELAVGVSDFALLLYGTMALQHIRVSSGTSMYVWLMALHIPIVLGTMAVGVDIMEAEEAPSGRPSSFGPSKLEVFFHWLHQVITIIGFLLFATAPLIALLLFGRAQSALLNVILFGEILVVLFTILFPGAYARTVHRVDRRLVDWLDGTDRQE